MLVRASALGWFSLLSTSAFLTLQACAVSSTAVEAPGAGGADGIAGAAGGATAGSIGSSGTPNLAGGGQGGASKGGSGGAPVALGGQGGQGGAPEPVFDASGLTVVGSAGPALCRLSADGRYLLVGVKNSAAAEAGATEVRVATDAGSELRVRTPVLSAAASGELKFDRGPLVGFVPTWKFSVTIDPDGKHGGPQPTLKGECSDLRSRSEAGMAPLATWYDSSTGLWNHTDWWTSANQLETVIDYSRETGDTKYFDEIDNTFVKNAAGNFDQYGYYDDDGWFAIAWVKAYELTHQQKYLDMAKTIFKRMTGGWDAKCGGGIYWASAKAGADGLKGKNAIANELFLSAAARLHRLTPGDAGAGSYLDWAQREWAWFKGTGMINADKLVVDGLGSTDCKPGGPIFTYNQGALISGLVDLGISTGDPTLIDQASAMAHATMAKMADPNGVLKEPGCGGDICVQFKGVFMRNLAYLYRARPLPEFQAYMRKQSDAVWNISKNGTSQFGYEWHLPFDKASASRQSSALDATNAALMAANMNLALGATVTSGSTICAGSVPAYAADGSSRLDSKWCAGGGGNQYLTLDLGSARYIVGFRLRHAGAGGETSVWNTRDFEIETSADNKAWTQAVKVTGNTADVTTHPIPAVTARYARLHVTTAQTDPQFLAARIYEFEVYGIGL